MSGMRRFRLLAENIIQQVTPQALQRTRRLHLILVPKRLSEIVQAQLLRLIPHHLSQRSRNDIIGMRSHDADLRPRQRRIGCLRRVGRARRAIRVVVVGQERHAELRERVYRWLGERGREEEEVDGGGIGLYGCGRGGVEALHERADAVGWDGGTVAIIRACAVGTGEVVGCETVDELEIVSGEMRQKR
jgi:hypothetical protein